MKFHPNHLILLGSSRDRQSFAPAAGSGVPRVKHSRWELFIWVFAEARVCFRKAGVLRGGGRLQSTLKGGGSRTIANSMTNIGSGFFRLILASLVVLHHCSPLRLGGWAVYAFFILSGYWICRLWNRRYVHTRNPLLTFLVSRWWRLAPVFLLCTLLGEASNFLLGAGIALHLASSPSWWLRQLLIAGSNGAGTDLPPTWSLDVEMQFYLFAPLLVTLFGRIGPFFRWMSAAGACGWFGLFLFRGGNFQLAQLSLFVGFFLIGIAVQMTQWRPSSATGFGSLLIFLGVTLVLAIYPPTQRGVWRAGLDVGPLPFAVSLWWIMGAGVVIPFLAWNVSQDASRFDRFLGNLAYPLYLFHWIPRDWYYHFSLRSDPIWRQCTFLAMNFLVAASGAIIILLLVDQPSERFREAWVSSRRKKSKDRENHFSGSEPTSQVGPVSGDKPL
jgi:peptidoglycan/LPS O-acetylase OafA/YrhL